MERPAARQTASTRRTLHGSKSRNPATTCPYRNAFVSMKMCSQSRLRLQVCIHCTAEGVMVLERAPKGCLGRRTYCMLSSPPCLNNHSCFLIDVLVALQKSIAPQPNRQMLVKMDKQSKTRRRSIMHVDISSRKREPAFLRRPKMTTELALYRASEIVSGYQ